MKGNDDKIRDCVVSFIGEVFVQNMMRVVANIREEVVVHVSSQLEWCGIVADVG